MSPLGAFDPLLAVLYGAYKLRGARALILVLGLGPAVLYALPAQPCGCIRPLFVRCTGSGRQLAYRAAMRSDLKNLASQQEIYYSDHSTYSASESELAFVRSSGVEVTLVATPEGWSARAIHTALGEGEACAMYFGNGPPPSNPELAGAAPGELVCVG